MWKFMELRPGEPERDPREAEFFRLTEPAEAVVREVIQNSLDAKREGVSRVRVCFVLGNAEAQAVNSYFEGLEPHLKACNLLPSDYADSSRISFLTIEDFGTTGLDGVTGEDGPRPKERSNFYSFWLCEGKSRKSGKEAGRWGLGKTTFHFASKLMSFWGLTVRQDDSRELLMGKALLKTHRIDNAVYNYYGYFRGKNYKPVSDVRIIQNFKQKFSISRNGEPGFSLVIPMPEGEITASALIKSVIIHYFFAIMKGMLEVEIKDLNNGVTTLNARNIIEIASSQEWYGTSWDGVNVTELLQFVNDSILCNNINEFTKSGDETLEITENSLGNRLAEFRESFNAGNLMAFRIHLEIKVKYEPPSSTHFEVFIKKHPQLKQSEEFYIRSGIKILDIKTLWNRPVRGLLVAEETPIAAFLGDSETPAHTEWNERTEGFTSKYDEPKKTLRFIKKSMSKIVSVLDQAPQERQRDFLKEIFFVPESTPQEGKKRTRRQYDFQHPQRPSSFKITQIRGGFKISLRENIIKLPIHATVTVAYDVRKGNPFKQYDIFDFDLESDSISIASTGCTILSKNRNIMKIEVTDNNFNLKVMGFDPKRDLVVSVKEEK